jgi:muramoyltetrapeptide carboxypeptidase
LNAVPLRPPRLGRGDRLAIYTPAFPGPARHPERAARGCAALQRAGFQVVVPEAAYGDSGFTAGTPAERAAALMALFADDSVDGIVCSIGGFNSNDIVSLLDYGLIARHPKVLVGYSDCSALLLAIHARAGLVTFHGPALLPEWGEYPEPLAETMHSFREVTGEARAPLVYRQPGRWTNELRPWGTDRERSARVLDRPGGWRCLREGSATGRLLGGNVETINGLVGSDYCSTLAGALLFIEATAEEAYLPRVERALRHLEIAGLTRGLAGLMVARCPDAQPCDGVTLDDVVRRFGERHLIPVAADMDFGHTDPKLTLPLGVQAELVCRAEQVELQLLEPAVGAVSRAAGSSGT